MGKNCCWEVVSRLERYINSFWEVQLPKTRMATMKAVASLIRVFIWRFVYGSILFAKVGIIH